MVKRKLVVVPVSGPLPELQGKFGPLRYPTRITVRTVAEMVKNGKTVYECDPSDPENGDKRVLLTLENVSKDNFVDSKKTGIEDFFDSNENGNDKECYVDFPRIKPAGPVSTPKEEVSVEIPKPEFIGVDPASGTDSTVIPNPAEPAVSNNTSPSELVIEGLKKMALTSETPDSGEKNNESPASQIPDEKTSEETKKEVSKDSTEKQTDKRTNKGKGKK